MWQMWFLFFSPDNKYHATSAALEYAVQLLEVKHIVVFGHAHCGGVHTALKETCKSLSSNDFIGQWISLLAPAAEIVLNNKSLSWPEKQTALEQLSIRYSLRNFRDVSVDKIPQRSRYFNIAWGLV